jgi:hypothetical protein
MKNEHGQDMARLGDNTDYGGMVIEAATSQTEMDNPDSLVFSSARR